MVGMDGLKPAFKSGDTFNVIAVSSEVYITGEVLSYHLLLQTPFKRFKGQQNNNNPRT